MTLLDPSETDSEGNVRSFSVASAPHEEALNVSYEKKTLGGCVECLTARQHYCYGRTLRAGRDF